MERSYDITLVSPPSRMINHYRPPLALMYVARKYMDMGRRVKIIDVPMKQIVRDRKFLRNKESLVNEIKNEMLLQLLVTKTDVIGISCYSPEYNEVKDFISDIRKIKSSKILVGGIHPTLYPQNFDKVSDYLYKGRCDNGNCEYSLIDMQYYSLPNPYAIRGVFLACAYVLASFGCNSRCSFCVAPGLREHFGKPTFKTPQELMQEVETLKKKYRIDGFYIIDDLYTMNKKNVLDFCKLIKPTKLLWGCNAKVNTLDEEMIKAMAEANCIQIDFGVERGNNEELKKLKKDITIEQVKRTFSLCKRFGIRTFANFLVGVPGESKSGLHDIEQIIQQTRPTLVSINKFIPYQGTELFEEGIRYGHSQEVERFVARSMKRYNSVWNNLKFALSLCYLMTLLRSKRKLDYLRQIPIVLMEVINQKWLA